MPLPEAGGLLGMTFPPLHQVGLCSVSKRRNCRSVVLEPGEGKLLQDGQLDQVLVLGLGVAQEIVDE